MLQAEVLSGQSLFCLPGQGFPDFACHKMATRGAQETLQHGRHDQYSPVPGSMR